MVNSRYTAYNGRLKRVVFAYLYLKLEFTIMVRTSLGTNYSYFDLSLVVMSKHYGLYRVLFDFFDFFRKSVLFYLFFSDLVDFEVGY